MTLPSQVIFLHSNLSNEKEILLRKTIADNRADRIPKAVAAIDPSCVIVLAGDEVLCVVEDTLLDKRLKTPDIPLGLPTTLVVKQHFLAMTQLRVNRILGERPEFSSVVFSWGNLFGDKSIVLGLRFHRFMKSDDFMKMVGRKLKNVMICLGADQEYSVTRWDYR